MEEKRVIGASVLNKPVHGAQNVLLGRLAHGALLVVGQGDHIFALVAKGFLEVVGHVLNIVDATSQLALLTKVVDADQQSLSPAGAVGVLERVAVGSAMTESLGLGRRWWGSVCTVVVLVVDVLAGGICCCSCASVGWMN